jgi:ABC-type nickel/cobalt efflux system permease component RcnA
MNRLITIAVFCLLFGAMTGPAWSHNPFTTKPETQHTAPEPPIKSQFFVKIIVWQHQLKQNLSELIRVAQTDNSLQPLLLLMGLAFAYGVVHAAGPGHGKAVAMSYVLSHRPSLTGGIVFGLCIAVIHGLSGIIGVLGLRYVIERSVSQTLASVTSVTQVVSFGLITILGLVLLVKHIHALSSTSEPEFEATSNKAIIKGVWPWALAVGVVPCPAVVMVMLFCLSMDVMMLGLLLSICISLGMGSTISMVVGATIVGKAGAMRAVSPTRAKQVECVVGVFSGVAITGFGALLLIPAIYAVMY